MDLQRVDDRDDLILTVLGEAAGEPSIGKAAVAFAAKNRLDEGWGSSLSDVVRAPRQFSTWNTPEGRARMASYRGTPAYNEAGAIVDGVLSGAIKDPTGGATHFAQVETSDPVNRNGWIRDMIAKGNAVKIGAHTFGRADAGKPKAAAIPGDLELVEAPSGKSVSRETPAPDDLELVAAPAPGPVAASQEAQDGRAAAGPYSPDFSPAAPPASNLEGLRAGLMRTAAARRDADQRAADLELVHGDGGGLDSALTFGLRANNTALLNIPRRAAAAVAAIAGSAGVPGFSDRGFSGYYQRAKDQEAALERLHPTAAIAGDVAGMVGGAVALPGAGVGSTMLRTGLRNAGAAGLYGGAAEAIDQFDDPQAGAGKVAAATGLGMGAGFALTPVAHGLGKVVGKIIDRFRVAPSEVITAQGNLTPAAVQAITEAGVDPAAVTPALLHDLNALAATKGVNAASVREAVAGRWGVNLTEGQAAADPARQRFERTAAGGGHGDEARGIVEPFLADQQAQVRSAKDSLGRSIAGPGNEVADPLEAAAVVAGGVQGRARAAKRGYQADYDAAAAEPGTFQAGTFDKVGAEIGSALESHASDPVFIDKVQTPQAHRALELLGEIPNLTLGGVPPKKVPQGVLPAAPAAGAGSSAPSAPSAAAAPGGLPGAPGGASGAPVASSSVFTPGGRKVETEFRLVDAGELKTSHGPDFRPNPDYPADLQPRDRGRAASEAQVVRMSRELEPERLGASPSAGDGAPIVGPDGLVESGNGRVMAIRRAYSEGGDAAGRYRTWLEGQGYDVAGMKEPVLVRVRTSDMTPADRVAFAREANAPATMTMGAAERAAADAKRLPDEALELYRGGDVTSPENRGFARSFIAGLEKGEEGSLVTADGALSLEGKRRLETALLHRAYGDGGLVAGLAETGDDGLRAFGGVLQDVAGDVAKLKGAIGKGEVSPGADLSPALLEAAKFVQAARSKGIKLSDAVAQQDAFSPLKPETLDVLRTVYGGDLSGRVNRSRAADALRGAVDEAGKQSGGPSLFGDAPLSAGEILKTRAAKPTADAAAPVSESGTLQRPAASSGTPGDPITMTAAEYQAALKAGTLPGSSSSSSAPKVAAAAAPATVSTHGEIDMRGVDQARRRLVGAYKAAKSAATPGSTSEDMRAVSRVIHEFDGRVEKAMDDGLFSGSDEALTKLRAARAAFASYQRTFKPQGAGDDVGRAMQKIVERDARPVEVANMLFGQAQVGAKGSSQRIAERLKTVLGEDSPEWAAVRQGLWQRLTTRPEGVDDFGAQAISQRIGHFLSGDGRDLSRAVFAPEELRAIGEFGSLMRTLRPMPNTTNPSQSGYVLGPMLKKLGSHSAKLLAGLGGLVDGGITGTAIGYGLGKFVEGRGARSTVRQAQRAVEGAPRRPADPPVDLNLAPGIGSSVSDMLP